jgi:hypothetical protein
MKVGIEKMARFTMADKKSMAVVGQRRVDNQLRENRVIYVRNVDHEITCQADDGPTQTQLD